RRAAGSASHLGGLRVVVAMATTTRRVVVTTTSPRLWTADAGRWDPSPPSPDADRGRGTAAGGRRHPGAGARRGYDAGWDPVAAAARYLACGSPRGLPHQHGEGHLAGQGLGRVAEVRSGERARPGRGCPRLAPGTGAPDHHGRCPRRSPSDAGPGPAAGAVPPPDAGRCRRL